MTLTSKSRIDGNLSLRQPGISQEHGFGYGVVVMPTPVIPSTFNPVSGLLLPDVLDSIRDYKPRYFLRIDSRLTFSNLPTRRQRRLFAVAWIWRITELDGRGGCAAGLVAIFRGE